MEHTERLAEKERVNQLDVVEMRAAYRSDRTLYEILDDFAERIPQEVKDQFSEDFIENMDHYLYGASKRWPPSS